MQKGNIGVTTENIFPVIKKFLYSDHEIFLREIVSNAIDATQKLKTLYEKGEFKGELGDLKVTVKLNADSIVVSDNGIGLTTEEIDKYINQIALSGATDFLEKYKDSANSIIGHFGLGFYSAFMVSKRVEIVTKSYKEGAQAIKWSCDGSPEYEITEAERDARGTDIIMYIDDDSKEFLEESRISAILNKYCKFLPVEIVFGENTINNTTPLWTRKPSELKDEDYKNFYRELYPMSDEPLFWIHLNVDFPFHLTGVLYFPKIKSNIDMQRNKIQLYCNQVYVTDEVEGIVPDFLTLMHGVIDSPDIPLNVSRSYLQSDANVKKISGYISKKVSDRLQSIFKNDRKEFEEKWNDLKIFIHYGMLTEEDFYDKANKYALLQDTEGKMYTYEEYKTLVSSGQTDKEGNIIYLYANNKEKEYGFIEAATAKGYNVLLMDGQLDVALISLLERKFEKTRFTRVDSDTVERLIVKEEQKASELNAGERDILTGLFQSQLPKMEKKEFFVQVQAMGADGAPMMITQSEYMRRMKDMAAIQPGMGFYGEMADMYNVVLNEEHPIIKRVLADAESGCSEKLQPIDSETESLEARHKELYDARKDKKEEDIPQSEKDEMADVEQKITKAKSDKEAVLAEYAVSDKYVRQLIDITLLQNNMLTGEALNNFVKRSIELMK